MNDDPGYYIIITLINNVGANRTTGGKVQATAVANWPLTDAGRAARDQTYDALPTQSRNMKKRFEASIDRVGPSPYDFEGTRRIPVDMAEAILGKPLSEAFDEARQSPTLIVLDPEVFEPFIVNTGQG